MTEQKPPKAVIYCCVCEQLRSCQLVTGAEIYGPGTGYDWARFFQCPECGGYVSTSRTGEPLGTIPTKEIRALRSQIHAVIDPIWRSGTLRRGEVYKRMARALGIPEYHTAELSTVDIAERALKAAYTIQSEA